MKKIFFLSFLLATPLCAEQYPSDLSVGLEGGIAKSGLSGYGSGGLFGGRIKYDFAERWGVAARFQNRTFEGPGDDSRKTTIQPVTAEILYNFLEPSEWTPYAFAEAGISNYRNTVFAVTTSGQKPAVGLGLGLEWRPLTFNSLSLEAAHRSFLGASPKGGQASENSVSLTINFYIPDEWIPIHPDSPLNIPDIDDAAAKPSGPALPDVEKRQAQMELDKVQQDIREKKVPPIHFETGQAVLLEASHETLDIVGTILRRYPSLSVLITGHTDNVGTEGDNQILSLARAEVVRAYLIQNFGLPSEKLTAKGAGQTVPIADNATEDGRFLNRRVEFTIQP